MINIYVGNLPYEATEDQLREAFGAFGTVLSAKVITDRATGRPRGFGFIEMEDDEQGKKAIDELNGSDMGGRTLVVNLARAKR